LRFWIPNRANKDRVGPFIKLSRMNLIKKAMLAGASLFLIIGCSNSTEGVSVGSTWSPPAFPTIDESGAMPPQGPQEITLEIVSSNIVAQGKGYISLGQNGECSLDVRIEEKPKGASSGTIYEIVKSKTGPAYISNDGQFWLDTRDPGSPLPPLSTLVNPIGFALSGVNDFQSLCFLSALPALTSAPLATGEYPWNPVSVQSFVDASNQSFLAAVLGFAGVEGAEYDKIAQSLVELAGLPETEFTQYASLVQVAKDKDAVKISYLVGVEEPIKVVFTLTPTSEKIISPPRNAQDWEAELVAMGEVGGVRSILERFFALK